MTHLLTLNIRLALDKTCEAVSSPKLVIPVGACAISGGPYRESPGSLTGASSRVPVDLLVPNFPPPFPGGGFAPPRHLTLLDGLLRLLGRME